MFKDRLRHRSPVLMAMLVFSLPTLFIYANIGSSRFLHAIWMGMLGITISGPYNLIVGSISVDLGSQPALAGNMDVSVTSKKTVLKFLGHVNSNWFNRWNGFSRFGYWPTIYSSYSKSFRMVIRFLPLHCYGK